MTRKKAVAVVVFIISVIFCIIVFLIVFTENANKNVYKSELEEKLYYANASYTNSFNGTLNQMMSVADTVAIQVGSVFKYSDYNREGRFIEDKEKMIKAVRNILRNEKTLSAVYITFNPELFPDRQEIWFIRKGDKIIQVDSASLAKTWLLKTNPNTKYFYDAMENGSFWGGPDWETILNHYNITYTRRIIDKEGVKLGIVGTDIISSQVTDTVSKIKVYRDSKAYLFNENLEYIAKGDNDTLTEEVYNFIKTKKKQFSETPGIYYFNSDNGRYVFSGSRLNNGWFLIIMQPEKTVLEPITRVIFFTWFLVGVTLFLLILTSCFLFKKTFFPAINKIEEQALFIIHQSRQAKLGEMIAGITHQLKQPVNNANIVLMNMQEDVEEGNVTDDVMQEHIKALAESINTMLPIINDFAGFLKPDREKTLINVKDEINSCLRLMRMKLSFAGVRVELQAEKEIELYGYKNEFVQCMLNVMGNALEALERIEDKRRIIRIKTKECGDMLVISIYNNGREIPAELQDRVFEPYVTTKTKDGGTGIGLYLTKEIIEEHFAGRIYYKNLDEGVVFIFEIPVKKEKESDTNA